MSNELKKATSKKQGPLGSKERWSAQDGSICMFSVVERCTAPTETPN